MRETLALEESEYGLRVYAVAPGIADTNMQALIRSADEEVFPAVKKFKEFKQTDAFNTVGLVAEHIRDLALMKNTRTTRWWYAYLLKKVEFTA